jgi:lipoyl(octanoyl) transferase
MPLSQRADAMTVEIQRLGTLPYPEAWDLQLRLLEERAAGRIPDTILVVEHPPVITYGRRLGGDNTPKEIGGVPLFAVERGGEATYHGPGQVVMYPLFGLDVKFGPKAFLRLMENAMIAVLASYGLESYWLEGKTGVWLKDKSSRERKIASLGIAVRKGVSYHGLALNVSTDLKYFELISPCGFEPKVMTTMKEQLAREISLREVEDKLAAELATRYEQRRA